jgi:hypothetical protein
MTADGSTGYIPSLEVKFSLTKGGNQSGAVWKIHSSERSRPWET